MIDFMFTILDDYTVILDTFNKDKSWKQTQYYIT